ncbi:MAG: riboflavin synthase [Acidobacteria bacterium]|nr:riboflavin synthase [Acidobacteriota bacterium]
MFTGIIEATGRIATVTPGAEHLRLGIETALAPALALGASLAVNGVCLTVVARDEASVWMDVGPQTARITTLGVPRVGQVVNLERPLRPEGRLDGHFVLGHVDGTGEVLEVRPDSESHWVTVTLPDSLAAYVIPKGSIAVDGISLTVATLERERFSVQVIPYTWTHTTLQHARVGDRVNLECDMIGKYVVRTLEHRSA